MSSKIRVGILFGGKSAEHEVSLQSAKSIIKAIDKDKYDLTLIGIDKNGQWHLCDLPKFLSSIDDPKMSWLDTACEQIAIIPGKDTNQFIGMSNYKPIEPIDVIFPILHGTYGEDGTMQGLLKLINIPFVGPGVLGSAIGMDKDIMKRLLRDAGIPIGNFLVFKRSSISASDFQDIKRQLGVPFFVKPANLGSSVGINKVKDKSQFKYALEDAFKYDQKILIEEFIEGREIECSILGNDNPIASEPGEIIPRHEFYSYETKYIDAEGAALKIPAELPADIVEKIKGIAVKTFKTLCCEGMSRVDFFLKDNGEVLVNEINTIPGFTNISMYPKLWEVSGIPYSELINRLIKLAIERFEAEKRIKTSFDLAGELP
ncbi:MAG: D-alanine--D-alanine ligase [Actinomycetota bacterium]